MLGSHLNLLCSHGSSACGNCQTAKACLVCISSSVLGSPCTGSESLVQSSSRQGAKRSLGKGIGHLASWPVPCDPCMDPTNKCKDRNAQGHVHVKIGEVICWPSRSHLCVDLTHKCTGRNALKCSRTCACGTLPQCACQIYCAFCLSNIQTFAESSNSAPGHQH